MVWQVLCGPISLYRRDVASSSVQSSEVPFSAVSIRLPTTLSLTSTKVPSEVAGIGTSELFEAVAVSPLGPGTVPEPTRSLAAWPKSDTACLIPVEPRDILDLIETLYKRLEAAEAFPEPSGLVTLTYSVTDPSLVNITICGNKVNCLCRSNTLTKSDTVDNAAVRFCLGAHTNFWGI